MSCEATGTFIHTQYPHLEGIISPFYKDEK